MTLWEATLLGTIQGLTEFLPISSTAHLLAARKLLGHPNPDDAFTTVVQLGTLAAVFLYFRRDLWAIARGVWNDALVNRIGSTPDSRLFYLMAIGTLPAGAVGFVFQKKIKAVFYNLPAMAVVAIVFALIMWAAEAYHRKRKEPAADEEGIDWLTALWMGAWQMLALMPGASRSGCTISGGLFAGLARSTAARFSFLLSLPVILAAGLKDLYDANKQYDEYQSATVSLSAASADETPEVLARLRATVDAGPGLFGSADEMTALAVATAVSAVVGYLSIAWLLGFLRRYSMNVFVVYRLALGVLLLALIARGVLPNH
jgi:undecaprenyl-diphosphatase